LKKLCQKDKNFIVPDFFLWNNPTKIPTTF